MQTIRFAMTAGAIFASAAMGGDFFVAGADSVGLIAAVQAANADPGPDTIHLGAGSVYVFSAATFNFNALPVTEGVLVIEGNGATIERISASGFRLITNDGQLTLNDLTITGGSLSTGAGIRNNALLVLNDCTLSENRGGGNGGALYNPVGARIEATNTVFHRNAADGHGGGVVSNDGEIVFTACTIIENEAAQGGAINSSGSAVVEGCVFADNFTTSGLGGAITNFNNGTLEVTASGFTGSRAGSSGGAIAHRGVSMTLEDCTFHDNAAQTRSGGALYIESGSASARRCVFTANAASEHGGAIDTTVFVTLTDCLVSDNTATLDGGGLHAFNNGGFDLDRVTVAANIAGREGGGVFVFNAPNSILNSTISDNHAGTEGGGVRLWQGTDTTLTYTTIHANTAGLAGGSGGGGIRVQSGPPAMINTIVSGSTGGDIVGAVNDLGFNLVQDGSGLTEPTSISADPMLAPLDDNGGLTPTHRLIFGSPAIHAGNCLGGAVTTDQRGVARPQDPFGCDIGAYEAPLCVPDLNGDVKLDFFDLSQFLVAFNTQQPDADLAEPFGEWNFFDISAYLNAFHQGCP